MIPLTLAEIATATNGQVQGDATVTGAVTLDSRAVQAGDLFVAVPGERVDGHDFLAAAAASGAAAALVTRPDPALPCVVVEDPVVALDPSPGRLGDLGHGQRDHAGVPASSCRRTSRSSNGCTVPATS